uniref:Uncharacterized protein n=1 Tax=Arundo donax TaxID=35708 RepID=A0A0A9HQK9_ARUDO
MPCYFKWFPFGCTTAHCTFSFLFSTIGGKHLYVALQHHGTIFDILISKFYRTKFILNREHVNKVVVIVLDQVYKTA